MPSKEAVIIGITKDRYSGGEVRHLLNSITHIEAERQEIEDLKTDLKNKIEGKDK